MTLLLSSMICVAALGFKPSGSDESIAQPPRSVRVLPVFFVPKDQVDPTADQSDRFMRHLEWTRKRYAELLPGHITFKVAGRKPVVFHAPEDLAFYRAAPQGGAPRFVDELLDHLKYSRYNCPYILLVMLMNPIDGEPGGGGRPINGGFNTGGGIVIMSSYGLDHAPNVQSTFQHELGHSFGLPHVDVYGYDMAANPSLMSYNPNHHTSGFTPSKTPGTFVPEDLRGLALNQRVFPGLQFDPKRDVPKGYRIAPQIVGLGPMDLPGQLDRIAVTTPSGEGCDSLLTGPDSSETVWRSEPSSTGWASLDVVFPLAIPLTRVVVHVPAGKEASVKAVRVSTLDAAGQTRRLTEEPLKTPDTSLNFPAAKSRTWRLEFQTGESGSAVVKGLEFFTAEGQVFPPLVPYR